MRNRAINAVRIGIADPKKVSSWGQEVTRPETINYRTGLPEPDGLFCEKIFGPTKNFECYCGRYKNVRREGLVCEVCGVKVTHSRIRRREMGIIKLSAPVIHPWFLHLQPYLLQTILGLTKRATKQIVYYMRYMVVSMDRTKKERLLTRKEGSEEPIWDLTQTDPVVGEEKTPDERFEQVTERLEAYEGQLKEWAESEILLERSRFKRPDYLKSITPIDLFHSYLQKTTFIDDVIDSETGEVLLRAGEPISRRRLEWATMTGADLKMEKIRVGKSPRTLVKAFSQRLKQEEIAEDVVAGDGHVMATKGTILDEIFWDVLLINPTIVVASKKQRDIFEEHRNRKLREMEQIVNGLDVFYLMEEYRPAEGGDTKSLFMLTGPKRRNLEKISKIITHRGNIPCDEVFQIGSGGSGLTEVLSRYQIQEVVKVLDESLKGMPKTRAKKVVKRLTILKQFLRSERFVPPPGFGLTEGYRPKANRLEWMVLKTIPVIPPDLRPIVSLEGGRQATSDINELYHRVVTRNARLRNMQKIRAPEVIVNNEKRLLQQSVDALIDNARRDKPDLDPNGRPFESLTDTLRGKKGRFRQNLLGKRVDYSARAVIVAGPRLKLWQCGLPKTIALELYKPKLIHLLESEGLVENGPLEARDLLDDLRKRDPSTRRMVWDLLSRLVSSTVILLNRAPTLHRLGIQAFQPILTDESSIRLHPLVCGPFNADFDGDQMAVHLPLSNGAQAEARLLMLSSNNLIVPGTGDPSHMPSQDIVLGIAHLTSTPKKKEITVQEFRSPAKLEKKFAGYLFADDIYKDEKDPSSLVVKKWEFVDRTALKALKKAFPKGGHFALAPIRSSFVSPAQVGVAFASLQPVLADGEKRPLSAHDVVGVMMKSAGDQSSQSKRMRYTTVGRILLNSELPDWYPFVDRKIHIKGVKEIYQTVLRKGTQKEAVALIDGLKDLGFRHCTLAGISLSVDDITIPKRKNRIVELAEQVEDMIDEAFEKGKINASLAGMLNQRLGTDIRYESVDPVTRGFVEVKPNELGRPKDKAKNNLPKEWSDGKCPLTGKKLKAKRFSREEYEKSIEALWSRATDRITERLMAEAPEGNTLMMMIRSGARGKIDQVRQLAGMRGLMADPSGRLILVPIKSNFKEGLSAHEYFSSTHGARKGQTDTALRTSRSGYLTRRLVDMAHGVYIAQKDCGTLRYITKRPHIGEDELEWDTFARRIEGRVLAGAIVNERNEVVVEDNTLLDKARAQLVVATVKRAWKGGVARGLDPREATRRGLDGVLLRSPITCGASSGICATCYGESRSTGGGVTMGDPVGVIAAQSIGEPGTQLTMRTFHTGGVAGADVSDITKGLPLAEIFFEVYASRFKTGPDKEGAILSPFSGSIQSIKSLDKEGSKWIYEIAIKTKGKRKAEVIRVPWGRALLVKVGDSIRQGDNLSDGFRDPLLLMATQGPDIVQAYILDTIQNVYRSQGVEIFDVHFEVILREMLRYVSILGGGDSTFMQGQIIPINEVEKENVVLAEQSLKPIRWKQLVVGLKKGASIAPSFLSAASFQQTAKALLHAAIEGRVDHLNGLKENVIVGERIPVGTGHRALMELGYEEE